MISTASMKMISTASIMAAAGGVSIVPFCQGLSLSKKTDASALPQFYRNEKVLGKGGYGAVYKVTTPTPFPGDRSLVNSGGVSDYTYAMKVVLPVLPVLTTLANPEQQLDALKTEAQFLVNGWTKSASYEAPVSHENIVSGYFAEFADGVKNGSRSISNSRSDGGAELSSNHENKLFIELLDGGSVMELLNSQTRKGQKGLSFKKATQITLDVARGLEYLSSRNVIHADIKPENIMLEQDSGRAKIVDFGGAFPEGEPARHVTMLYAPLEMKEGGHGIKEGNKCESTAKLDVYSLGRILVYMLSNDMEAMEESEQQLRSAYTQSGATAAKRITEELIDRVVPLASAEDASAEDASARKMLREVLLNTLESDAALRWSASELVQFIEGEGENKSKSSEDEKKSSSDEKKRTIIIIVIAAAAACVLIAIIACCCCRGKKNDGDEPRRRMKEEKSTTSVRTKTPYETAPLIATPMAYKHL